VIAAGGAVVIRAPWVRLQIAGATAQASGLTLTISGLGVSPAVQFFTAVNLTVPRMSTTLSAGTVSPCRAARAS
jgi:hypothetical protein